MIKKTTDTNTNTNTNRGKLADQLYSIDHIIRAHCTSLDFRVADAMSAIALVKVPEEITDPEKVRAFFTAVIDIAGNEYLPKRVRINALQAALVKRNGEGFTYSEAIDLVGAFESFENIMKQYAERDEACRANTDTN